MATAIAPTSRARRLIALLGVLTLALALSAALSGAADAKKKKKKSGKAKVFALQKQVNAAVPDAAPPAPSALLESTINVPKKKFKGKVVGDLNVTGLQTTGSEAGAANDMVGYLTAPNGRTLQLFWHVGDQSIGPWTMDDEAQAAICNNPPGIPCADPNQSLYAPFAGTSDVTYNWAGAFPVNGLLQIFNGVPMRGAWTLTLVDTTTGAGNGTNVLNQWGLRIASAKPVKG